MNEQTKQFILSHLNDDVRKLALSKTPDGVDLRFALQQIDGRQRAKTKLPTLAANPDIIFPVHLSVEQCSSEATAAYKARVLTPSNSPTGGGQSHPGNNLDNNLSDGLYPSPVGRPGGVLIDLTGGFGVDFIALSKLFEKAIYVERNPDLCAIAEQNFHTLNLTNTHIINSEAEDFLNSQSPPPTPPERGEGVKYDSTIDNSADNANINPSPRSGGVGGGLVFFADPARRSESGSRTYAISDCTPDILQLIPLLKNLQSPPSTPPLMRERVKDDSTIGKTSDEGDIIPPPLGGRVGVGLLLKLSPMLDWHKAVDDIQAQGVNVSEVHIVSVKNECKELLLLVELQEEPQASFRLFCVDLQSPTPALPPGGGRVKYDSYLEIPILSNTNLNLSPLRGGVGGGLLIPNASIMKAGCWDFLISRFGVTQADPNSHIFFSDHEIADFPGKQYRIQSVCSMNKKELRSGLQGITHANIAVRNFPLSADALRKRLKLKDGGSTYIFGTTIQGEHKLIIATPPNLPTREE